MMLQRTQTKAVLTVLPSGDDKFWVTDAMGNTKIDVQVRLPNLECDHCILKRTYRNGKENDIHRCFQIEIQ